MEPTEAPAKRESRGRDPDAALETAGRVSDATDEILDPEWLDQPGLSKTERRRGIADLRRVNGFLFGRRPVIATVLSELRHARGRQLLLDVAAGAGDVGAAIVRATRRRGLEVKIVA